MRNWLVAILLLLAPTAFACLWDFDTLRDEKRGLPGVAELLAGRYERHSRFFYEQRVAQMTKRLADHPDDLAALDNLAVAYEKLDDRDHAIATMVKKDQLKPGEYTTYANLGTFYLHKGDYEHGIENIKKALAINPDAHFGREWVQLKLAEYYLAAKTDPGLLTRQDFLGADDFREYRRAMQIQPLHRGDAAEPIDLPSNAMEGVIGILRFGTGTSAELYLVLGEMLEDRGIAARQIGHLHLAYRAYLRAIELKHPRSDAIRKHIDEDLRHWMDADPAGYSMDTIDRERVDGAAWLKAYQAYEDDLIRSGKDTESDGNYAAFYAAHPRVDDSTHFSDVHSWWSRKWYNKDEIVIFGFLVFSLVAVAFKVRNDRRKRRGSVAGP